MFVQRSHYMASERENVATGKLEVDVQGRYFVILWPGDAGPDGSTVTDPSLLSVVGRSTWTMDLETFVIDDWTLNGRVAEDVCAEFAG